MQRIVKTVAKMIKDLQDKAKTIFRQDPNAVLDSAKGFLERHADFGVYIRGGQAYLSENKQQNSGSNYQDLFQNTTAASPATNMLTNLNQLRYELWPEFAGKDNNFHPELNQFTALMRGYLVPIRRDYGDAWTVAKLSDKSMQLLKNHRATELVMHLNAITSIKDSDSYFVLSQSKKVARILTS